MRMIQTFTKNDLLRCLYNELPNQEKNELMRIQLTDGEFDQEVHEMESAKELLDGFILKAPEDAVENILAYSRSKS